MPTATRTGLISMRDAYESGHSSFDMLVNDQKESPSHTVNQLPAVRDRAIPDYI